MSLKGGRNAPQRVNDTLELRSGTVDTRNNLSLLTAGTEFQQQLNERLVNEVGTLHINCCHVNIICF